MAKNPGQTNQKELIERVDLARKLLCKRLHKSEIKAVFKQKYNASPRSVTRYLARARKVMLAETGKDRAEHIADSYGFYCEVAGNQTEATKERLKAQERIDKLLGLEQPQRLHHEADASMVEARRLELQTLVAELSENDSFANQQYDAARSSSGQPGTNGHSH